MVEFSAEILAGFCLLGEGGVWVCFLDKFFVKRRKVNFLPLFWMRNALQFEKAKIFMCRFNYTLIQGMDTHQYSKNNIIHSRNLMTVLNSKWYRQTNADQKTSNHGLQKPTFCDTGLLKGYLLLPYRINSLVNHGNIFIISREVTIIDWCPTGLDLCKKSNIIWHWRLQKAESILIHLL